MTFIYEYLTYRNHFGSSLQMNAQEKAFDDKVDEKIKIGSYNVVVDFFDLGGNEILKEQIMNEYEELYEPFTLHDIDENTKQVIFKLTDWNVFIKTDKENIKYYLDLYDINHCNNSGENALILAIRNREYFDSDEIVKELIEKIEDINHCNDYGDNALLLAICYRQLLDSDEIVKELIEKTKDINHCNDGGNNALILAIYLRKFYDSDEIVKELIDKTEDINHCDKDEDNALNLAIYFRKYFDSDEIINLIKSKMNQTS